MRRALAGLLLALGACAPTVTHGARVEPGLFVGYTGGIQFTEDTATSSDVLTPDWVPYARYGFVGRPGALAGSLALSLAAEAELGVQGDAYLQLPSRDPRWAYGGGVMASPGYLMPYAQLGRSFGRGYEVYTTQAYVRRGEFNSKEVGLGGGVAEVRPRYWAPTLALRRRDGAVGLSLQVTGAFGTFEQRAPDSTGRYSTTMRPIRGVSSSVFADVDIARALRDLAAITRRPIPHPAP